MGYPDRVQDYHLQLQRAGVGQHEPGQQRQGGQQQRDPRPRHHPHPGHHMEEVLTQDITPALAIISHSCFICFSSNVHIFFVLCLSLLIYFPSEKSSESYKYRLIHFYHYRLFFHN